MKPDKVIGFGKAVLGKSIERIVGDGKSGPTFNVSISIGNRFENNKDDVEI